MYIYIEIIYVPPLRWPAAAALLAAGGRLQRPARTAAAQLRS